ncbi:MAG: hypothetical protein IJD89_04345 [Clostridia bacterium]|nr:hypothetical protein [Clostridia bacterium]
MNNQSEEIGFLAVNVKTANGALPVENANVAIYGTALESETSDTNLSSSDVIFNLKTDKSGKTQTVALPTVAKELSLSPDNNKPYWRYNIYVTSNGYYDSTYLNVPVFQGITSLQEVVLIPLSEFASPTDPIPNSQRRYIESSN